MPFESGKSGNPDGRPKGAGNRVNQKLRELIIQFLEDNFATVAADFAQLDAKDRVRTYIDLLSFGVPKLQAVSTSIKWDDLTDEQLDEILNRLKGEA